MACPAGIRAGDAGRMSKGEDLARGRGIVFVLIGEIFGGSLPRRVVPVLAALVVVAGCASKPDQAAMDAAEAQETDDFFMEAEVEDDNDPLELPNRFIFAFNMALDVVILRPVAATYRFLLPVEVRDSIRNVLRNLRTPVVLANDLLQGDLDRAETTLTRFAINSTVGIGGLFDFAEDWGYPYHDEDFGQTLGVHGVGEGLYLVLPIFGPSSARDGVGMLVDTFLDPLTYVGAEYDIQNELLLRTVVSGIDRRSRNIETLEDLQRDAIDFYARIRSLYRQTRENDIKNGAEAGPTPTPSLSNLDFEFEPDDDQVGSKK